MYCSSCLPESAVLSPKLAMSVSKGNMAWACPVCWEEGLKDVAKLRGGLVGKRRKPTGSRGGGTAKIAKKKGNGAKSKAKDKAKAKKRKHGSSSSGHEGTGMTTQHGQGMAITTGLSLACGGVRGDSRCIGGCQCVRPGAA